MKNLPELVKANIVSKEVATEIEGYYAHKNKSSSNKLLIAFGILGAMLVGLGIILVLAHNWDELPRGLKVVFAFLPLLIGQLVCGFTLVKKPESKVFRESSTAFLILAIGSSISLVSQIYNIPGNVNTFLLSWMLLSLPLIYIIRSSIGSLLYLTGITCYAIAEGYSYYGLNEVYLYWLLLLGIVPHYFSLIKKNTNSGLVSLHNWLVPISIIIILGTFASRHEDMLIVTYLGLFGLFYALGGFFKQGKLRNNGFRILGSLGQISILLAMSFDDYIGFMYRSHIDWAGLLGSSEVIVALVLSLLTGIILYIQQRNKSLDKDHLLAFSFLAAIGLFFMSFATEFTVLFVNLLLLAIGLLTIRKGAREDHLGVLNYGLFIITALIVCRFFDTNINFIVKGVLFVLLGAGFFYTNYLIIKKRNNNVKK